MKKLIFLITILFSIIILSGCHNLGKEKTFNGLELYRAANISDSLANSLGTYLVKEKFADGKDKTVQLTLDDKTYHFKMVVKDGIEKDTGLVSAFKLFSTSLSADVFSGAPVVIELCNSQMDILKAYPSAGLGNMKIFNGVQVIYTPRVTMVEVDSLGTFLISSKFANGALRTVELNKVGSLYKFRMVVKSGAEKDAAYVAKAKEYAGFLSRTVFHGSPVEVDMCDDHLHTLVAVPM